MQGALNTISDSYRRRMREVTDNAFATSKLMCICNESNMPLGSSQQVQCCTICSSYFHKDCYDTDYNLQICISCISIAQDPFVKVFMIFLKNSRFFKLNFPTNLICLFPRLKVTKTLLMSRISGLNEYGYHTIGFR